MNADPRSLHILCFSADQELRAAFLELPERIYAGDAGHSPATRQRESILLVPAHPFFQSGTETYFFAFRGEEVVARCAAIQNPALPIREPGLGLIGFFECTRDLEAASAVLQEACIHLKSHGFQRVRAPVNRDTWHRYRVLCGGFDHPPVPMEPYNKPWYAESLQTAGFTESARYRTSETSDISGCARRYAPYFKRCLRNGFTFRNLDMSRFEAEILDLHRITLEIFAENHAYTPIGAAEFLQLYLPLRDQIDPNFVVSAFDPEGRRCGYTFAFPTPDGILHIKTVGVLPAVQGRGLSLALLAPIYERALSRGCTAVRHCLMKTDNSSTKFDPAATTIRQYALYEKELCESHHS
ncbi:MAG: GNAT family N-acetyltransferase [Verrucomicrobia bacterium]|nr:GNAT family N-acetyltransferase [Verrucomicrobiota bacterium]MCH8511581.1 GNAT family N-acetyltransferase [Kiritimatiellia bacterium]